MSVWSIICLVGAVIFGIAGAFFAVMKEKGAKYFRGYNKIPRHERKKYDMIKMSKAMRDEMFNWAGILFIGGVVSYVSEIFFATIAIILWVVVFIVKLFLDPQDELKKYKNY